MKNAKRALCLILVMVMVLSVTIYIDTTPSKAASYSQWTSVFDPDYYAAHCSGAAAYAQGDNEKLWLYFVKVGIPRGQQGCEEFDVFTYAMNYPDLIKSFGGNIVYYYIHYAKVGKQLGWNGKTANAVQDTDDKKDETTDDKKDDTKTDDKKEEVKPPTSGSLKVQYRTMDQIKAYMDNHKVDYTIKYEEDPEYQKTPYKAGKLSSDSLTSALNAVNTIRYIAGLSDVSLDSNYNYLCQAGCLVNAVNGSMSHTPTKPSGMEDALFNDGYAGTSSSNLGYGYGSPANTVWGWVDEGGNLGHRRWILNPSMKKTGFGFVGNQSAMYAFDSWSDSTDVSQVAWPAQVMPASLMSSTITWSISMGESVNKSSVNVTLTNTATDDKWTFSSSSANGTFDVDNENYGKQGCIIFKPTTHPQYKAGDLYHVVITGQYSSGTDFSVDYYVSIVNL